MAYSAADLASALVNAANGDKPIALTNNGITDNISTDSRWTNSTLSSSDDGTTSGVDITHSDFPLAGVSDGNLLRGSKATGADQADQYAVFGFTSSITIDTVFLKIVGLKSGSVDVDIQIADNGAFTTNLLTIAKFVGLPGGNTSSRLLGLRLCNHASMDNTPQSYSGVDFLRVKISAQSGTHSSSTPHITEFFAGQRRQWARGFMRPFDDLPYAADVDLFQGDGRKRQAYVRASGYSDLEGTYLVSETDRYSLTSNDLAVMRGMFTDTDYGCKAFAFVHKPSSDPYRVRVVRFAEPTLDLKNVSGASHREQSIKLLEEPPFYTADTAWTALTLSTSSLPNGTVSVAYSQSLAATGGASTGYETYEVSSGTLPAGLSMSDTGAITGTPTTAGTSSLTFKVRDISNATATKDLTITIDP